MTTAAIDYDGRVFRRLDGDTVARSRFHQHGDTVWAEVAGGLVRHGSLAGTCDADGVLRLDYHLVFTDGRVARGETVSTPETLDDGRVRLHETWRRHGHPGGSGTSTIEETARRDSPPQPDEGRTMFPPTLENAIYGLVTTPALRLADAHGLLAHLAEAGPSPSADVARELGLDADTVDRLLVVLAAAGILTADGGAFGVPPDVRPFVDRADPSYIGGFLEHLVDGTTQRHDRIERYLLRGKDVVDRDEPSPYDAFYQDEESTREFMAAMWHLSHGVSLELARLAELPAAGTLVDVGGANGPFAVAALRLRPGLLGVVFDLPAVRPHLERSARDNGLTDRLSFVAGDFFADDLPAGDVIALGYVMSNWPDEQCVEILRRARRACAPGGRVLLMERLFDDDRAGPVATAAMNLVMQVETRGRHRTVAEYGALLAAAGFEGCDVRRSTRDKHLVIGRTP